MKTVAATFSEIFYIKNASLTEQVCFNELLKMGRKSWKNTMYVIVILSSEFEIYFSYNPQVQLLTTALALGLWQLSGVRAHIGRQRIPDRDPPGARQHKVPQRRRKSLGGEPQPAWRSRRAWSLLWDLWRGQCWPHHCSWQGDYDSNCQSDFKRKIILIASLWLRENSTKTVTKVNEVAVEAARKRKKGDIYTTNEYTDANNWAIK